MSDRGAPDAEEFAHRPGNALRLAEHYAETDQLDRALAELYRELARNPEDERAHLLLGFILLELERIEEAEEEARWVLSRDPDSAEGLLLHGNALRFLGRNRDAEAALLAALHNEPENPVLLREYARLMLFVDQYPKAEALARVSLEFDPEDEETHALLGMIQLARGRGSAALASGARAIAHAPGEAIGHVAHAAASFRVGRIWRARRHIGEALRLDPTNEGAQELHEIVDLHSRLPALPLYYWSLLLSKIPGSVFVVWGIFVFLIFALPEMGVDPDTVTAIALGYLIFCVYTWVAMPLTRLWRRVIPLRI